MSGSRLLRYMYTFGPVTGVTIRGAINGEYVGLFVLTESNRTVRYINAVAKKHYIVRIEKWI